MKISDIDQQKIENFISILQNRINEYHIGLMSSANNIQKITGEFDIKNTKYVTIFVNSHIGKVKLWYIPCVIHVPSGDFYQYGEVLGNINDSPLNLDFFDPSRYK